MNDIPSRWAGRHDCELHYALAEKLVTFGLYVCRICGGTIDLSDEQWTQMQERAARKRAAIEAIPLEPPSPVRTGEKHDSN